MGTNVAGAALLVTAAGARTDDLIQIDDSSTGSANIIDVNISGVYTGNVLDITYSAASTGEAISVVMANNVAGSALLVSAAGARTDDLIKIDDSSTGNSHIFDINLTGIYTGNVLDIAFATAAATGEAVMIAMGTNVDGRAIAITYSGTGVTAEGSALDIAHVGALVAGADVVRITSDTGVISASSNVLAVEALGAGTSGSFAVYINASGANTEALKVDAGTVTFDETLTVTGAVTMSAAATVGTTLSVTGQFTGAAAIVFSGTETIAAGGTSTALSLTKTVHYIDADAGGDTFTLADGTNGQIATILLTSSTGIATVTPANLAGGTSVTLNADGDSVVLQFMDTEWFVLGGNSYAVV